MVDIRDPQSFLGVHFGTLTMTLQAKIKIQGAINEGRKFFTGTILLFCKSHIMGMK